MGKITEGGIPMPKATLTLPNGTVVTVEGDSDAIKELLDYYGASSTQAPAQPRKRATEAAPSAQRSPAVSEGQPDYAAIVNLVKNCEEAERIESQILDKTSQVDRTLLPLYIVHEHLNNALGLTSGDVSKVTTELGIPISQANASRTLSGTGSRYVIGDQVRKKGQPVRYKLSRRGLQYMKSVIAGAEDDDQE
jgi:hypothetical protein